MDHRAYDEPGQWKSLVHDSLDDLYYYVTPDGGERLQLSIGYDALLARCLLDWSLGLP